MTAFEDHIVLSPMLTKTNIGIGQSRDGMSLYPFSGCCESLIVWDFPGKVWVCSDCQGVFRLGMVPWPPSMSVRASTEQLRKFVADWAGCKVEDVAMEVFE